MKQWCACLLVSVVLVGCSGGNDGSGAKNNGQGAVNSGQPSALAGHWSGTATQLSSGKTTVASALIDRSGDAQLIFTPFEPILETSEDPPAPSGVVGVIATGPYFVLHANVCCSASYDGSAQARLMAATTASAAKLSASVAGGRLTGNFEYQHETYSYSFALTDDYAKPISLQDLAGVYTNAIGLGGSGTSSATESLVVANDGTITGSAADGCIYNGNITISDPTHNLFRMHLEIANCVQSAASMARNGEYDGLGTFVTQTLRFNDDPPSELTMLSYSVIGPVWPGSRGLTR